MKKASVLAIAAMALLSVDSAAADLGLPSTPSLPPVPTVTPPKVLDPVLAATPSAPQLPSVPLLPGVSVPQVSGVPAVPNVTGGSTLPSLPVRPPSTSTGGGTSSGGSAPSHGPSSGGSGTSSGGSARSGGSEGSGGSGGSTPGAHDGAGKPSADEQTAVQRVRRERRLRKTIQRLQGCLGSLSRLERRVLALRTGIGAGGPRTRTQVARRLDMSARRVTRIERRGMRTLRGLAAEGRCSAVSQQSIAGVPAEGTGVAPIAQVLRGMFGSGPSADRTEVKAERESSGGDRPADGSSTVTSEQRVTALPRARILGTDLTWPLVIVLSAGLVALVVRTLRRHDASSA